MCLWYLLTGAPSATGGRPDARTSAPSASPPAPFDQSEHNGVFQHHQFAKCTQTRALRARWWACGYLLAPEWRHLSSAFEADAGLVLMGVLIEKGELGALPSSLITVLPSFAVFDTSSTEADPSVSPAEIGELGAALSRFSLPLAASTSIHWPHITALFGMSNA